MFARVSALTLALPLPALACPVCFGNAESAEAEGAKWAILFLGGLTGIVLAGILAFAFRVRRRSKMTFGGSVQMPSPN